MKIQIYNTYEEMSSAAADLVAAQLRLKPTSHLGLTAGSTPIGMFAALTELYTNHHVSFADCWFYNLEEMVLPISDPGTCRNYFHRHFIDQTDAKPERLILPNGQAENTMEECAHYDKILEDLPDGQLDMQILGIGSDAHIGMNRPNEKLDPLCHPARSGKGVDAIAMGVSQILKAKRIILLANGEAKAQAVADMCHEKITTAIPATLLQLHPNVTIFLDKEAASKL